MKGWKRVFLLCILWAGTFLMWSGECLAWGPPAREDEDAFLEWYEENKDSEQPVTRKLSGDLWFSDEKEDPVVLNGTGSLTIDCNGHAINLQRKMVIDNPNLVIRGNVYGGFLILVNRNGTLALEQGMLQIEEGGVAIQVLAENGLICPSRGDTFFIEGEGRDVQGIAWTQAVPLDVSNLNVRVTGSRTAKAFSVLHLRELTVENCKLQAGGTEESYGIYCEGDPGAEGEQIVLRNSTVSAEAVAMETQAYSIFTPAGKAVDISCENSFLEPSVDTGRTYVVRELFGVEPVYTEAGADPGEWQLPDTVAVYVEETSGKESNVKGSNVKEERIRQIPVTWELPESAFAKPGYCIVKGAFLDETLDGELLNPDGIVPEATVLCLPPEKMFLIAYEVDQDTQKNGVKLVVPFPAGADSMRIEYSTDGVNFETYTAGTPGETCGGGSSNILEGIVRPGNHLLYFHIEVPVPDPVYYLRAVVQGDSIFAGTGPVWKIETGRSETLPPDVDDDGGGDRGGQDTEPVLPPNADDSIDSPSDDPEDEPASGPEDEPADGPEDEPASGPEDEPADGPVEKPTGNPVEETTEHPSDQPADPSADQPSGQSSDSPVNRSFDQPSGITGNQSVRKESQNPAPGLVKQVQGEDKEALESSANGKKAQPEPPWIPVVFGMAVLIGAGIWCGRKVFLKKS